MKSLAWTGLLCLVFTAQLQAQSLSLVKPIPPPNEQVLNNFSSFQGSPKDWINKAEIRSAEQVRKERMSAGKHGFHCFFNGFDSFKRLFYALKIIAIPKSFTVG